MMPKIPAATPAAIELLGPRSGALRIKLRGGWESPSDRVGDASDALLEAVRNAAEPNAQGKGAAIRIELDSSELAGWDTRVLVVLASASDLAKELGLQISMKGFGDGMLSLLR